MKIDVSIKRLKVTLIVWFIGILGCVVLYFVSPFEGKGLFPCPINFFTGLYCPGCGTTRALYCMVHLDFIKAFYQNIAFVILFPFLMVYLILRSLNYVGIIKFAIETKLNKKILIIIICILILYGILRNVPAMPFKLLAPHI